MRSRPCLPSFPRQATPGPRPFQFLLSGPEAAQGIPSHREAQQKRNTQELGLQLSWVLLGMLPSLSGPLCFSAVK